MKEIVETKVSLCGATHYVYQDVNGKVLWPAINFMNYVINDKESASTVATYRQAMRSLFTFLAAKDKDWLDMNDAMLLNYRDWQLTRSVNEPRWRGDINATMRNINHDYLFPIYEFYFWAQRQQLHPLLLGVQPEKGPQFQITSALPLRDQAKSKKDGPGQKRLYPKIFTNCGENDDRGKQAAEDWELEQLKDYIRIKFQGYQRASLLLIVRLGDETGLRPIALSGFVRSQFSHDIIERELLNTDKRVLEVTPRRQKGGNRMKINFPFSTVNGVVSYIENDLQEFLDETGFEHHNGHLFLNPKDGTPLTAEEITKIFSSITTALGWPKGKSYYALRHRYGNERMDLQASINDEMGFTKEENAVALQVSKDMTHRSRKTLIKEYLQSRMRYGHKTKVYQQAEQIQELRAQKEQLALETQIALEQAEKERKLANSLQREIKRLRSLVPDTQK